LQSQGCSCKFGFIYLKATALIGMNLVCPQIFWHFCKKLVVQIQIIF